MGALFSRSTVSEAPPETWVAPPPRAVPDPGASEPERGAPPRPAYPCPAAPGRPQCRPFQAEVDCSELDERDRPGAAWVAHTVGISRSSVVLRSRRMCYVGRRVLIAVHLIDDRPTALMGHVVSCEYDADGMHILDQDLLPLPGSPQVHAWLSARG